jgi:hypothetical protein
MAEKALRVSMTLGEYDDLLVDLSSILTARVGGAKSVAWRDQGG